MVPGQVTHLFGGTLLGDVVAAWWWQPVDVPVPAAWWSIVPVVQVVLWCVHHRTVDKVVDMFCYLINRSLVLRWSMSLLQVSSTRIVVLIPGGYAVTLIREEIPLLQVHSVVVRRASLPWLVPLIMEQTVEVPFSCTFVVQLVARRFGSCVTFSVTLFVETLAVDHGC